MSTTQRIRMSGLGALEEEGTSATVAGRLMQVSPATITLEDESDRRTFGFDNKNPDLTSVRLGDVVMVKLMFHNNAWRVKLTKVLVPCRLEGQAKSRWMQRWMTHGNKKRRNLILRDKVFQAVREFFRLDGFLEVQTPSLVACPGMEPNLTGFQTEWEGPDNAWKRKYHFPTSPEFHLKKMLALGYETIFELAKSYRNREYSSHHQPEFTMLEWYRAYEGYKKIMEDVEALVFFVAHETTGKRLLEYRGRTIDLTPPWKRISIRELFLNSFKIDLDLIKDPSDLARLAQANGFSYIKGNESFEECYFKLFLTEVELKLGWEKPVILYDYPAEMAALARLKPGLPRYAERFEVYLCGVELANAFGELNNVGEQTRRFDIFQRESRMERGFAYETDEDFTDALSFGMPPAAGIALGLDRLVMLLADETSLDAVLAFPHQSPVEEEMES